MVAFHEGKQVLPVVRNAVIPVFHTNEVKIFTGEQTVVGELFYQFPSVVKYQNVVLG
jgi:hypothetical protein